MVALSFGGFRSGLLIGAFFVGSGGEFPGIVKSLFLRKILDSFPLLPIIGFEGRFQFFLRRVVVVLTSCVRFSAVLLFVFAIAFFATACGDGGGGDATYASYFVPPAPSPTEPVPEPTADPAVDPTPDPTVDPTQDPAYENPFKGAKAGDMVKFGRYPQTASGEIQDIEWRVLAVEGDKVLAISRYGLDAKRFDDDSNYWESSEICGWLNGEFYNSSFNDDEKGIIVSSNPGKVFFLSKDEADRYFSSNEDRKCVPTKYAEANEVWMSYGCCRWWLRSPFTDSSVTDFSKYVSAVYYNGDADTLYNSVIDVSVSVRPALWINIYENPFKGANVGDTVKFGRYPQTASGEVQDIEWRVLAVENGKVLAISRYGLDAKRFDEDSNDWGSSEICGWLNGEFYNSSFNDDEKGKIASSDPGKVFLLSKDEADRYFSSDEDRKCVPTEYAKANYAWEKDGCCYWWLRSPNPNNGNCAYGVGLGGLIYNGNVQNVSGSARPALWINLEYENPFKEANVGDMVNFGRYRQTAAGDVQDIEWRVLAVENGKVLAISRYGLDAKRFDYDSNVWENSEIRGWLNGEFYDGSFNYDEKGIIASSDPGKVFLLNIREANGYFSSNDDRKCAPTEYAKTNGALEQDGCCCWWLRSPGPNDCSLVSCVHYFGGIFDYIVDDNRGSARPALWINLESE